MRNQLREVDLSRKSTMTCSAPSTFVKVGAASIVTAYALLTNGVPGKVENQSALGTDAMDLCRKCKERPKRTKRLKMSRSDLSKMSNPSKKLHRVLRGRVRKQSKLNNLALLSLMKSTDEMKKTTVEALPAVGGGVPRNTSDLTNTSATSSNLNLTAENPILPIHETKARWVACIVPNPNSHDTAFNNSDALTTSQNASPGKTNNNSGLSEDGIKSLTDDELQIVEATSLQKVTRFGKDYIVPDLEEEGFSEFPSEEDRCSILIGAAELGLIHTIKYNGCHFFSTRKLEDTPVMMNGFSVVNKGGAVVEGDLEGLDTNCTVFLSVGKQAFVLKVRLRHITHNLNSSNKLNESLVSGFEHTVPQVGMLDERTGHLLGDVQLKFKMTPMEGPPDDLKIIVPSDGSMYLVVNGVNCKSKLDYLCQLGRGIKTKDVYAYFEDSGWWKA